MRVPDRPQRAEQIVRVAWKHSLHPVEAGELVRPYIFRLRRKLEEHPEEPKMILTLRGRGYLFASLDYSPLA
jgi:DNA-binding response OmpR family regulator